jgi:uncharacterized membrane protein
MTTLAIYSAALFIGVIAGLRTFTAPAVVSWAAALGSFHIHGTWLAFMGSRITAGILTALALFELVIDQLPTTPSRKIPAQFGARIVSGAIAGATIAAGSSWVLGLVIGVVGAILGTLAGARFRASLAGAFRRDRPAAFVEDAIAIVGAILIVAVLV